MESISKLIHFKRGSKYAPLSAEGDEEHVSKSLITEETISRTSSESTFSPTNPESRWKYKLSLLLNILLLCLIALLLAINMPQMITRLHDRFNNTLIRQVSMPSPIFDELHIPLSTVRRNGSLLPDHPRSPFREPPSPEVDAAWHRISNINPIPISAQDVRNIGYDPEKVAKWPEAYGLGDDAYVGRLDVFHEIHCLDMLRKDIYFDHYHPEWTSMATSAPEDHQVHISHCIYALLQSILCSANTDPFIHYWVDIGDEPYPDFSINRQCRDFESILAWQEEKSIPMSKYRGVIKKPNEAIPQIMSDEYKYMVGLVKASHAPSREPQGDFEVKPDTELD